MKVAFTYRYFLSLRYNWSSKRYLEDELSQKDIRSFKEVLRRRPKCMKFNNIVLMLRVWRIVLLLRPYSMAMTLTKLIIKARGNIPLRLCKLCSYKHTIIIPLKI